jgi:hypothetical protein
VVGPACPASARGTAEARPTVAEIFRRHGPAYLCQHPLPPAQAKVLRAVIACRTAVLGGHLDVCLDCGHAHPAYNSCRDRHCPTCQSSQAKRWLEGRLARVLPTPYFHVVFTLPEPLRAVALANPKVVYDLLFAAATDTLQTLAATHLHAQLGITAVLHTWTREMLLHPHLHCIVTGGGLALDGTRWVACRDTFLFRVEVMGALFRGRFMAGLVRAHKAGTLRFSGTSAGLADPVAFAKMRKTLYATPWVVFAKRPFGGPRQVIAYLSRYTHRVAISNARVRAVTDDTVVISTRKGRTCVLAPTEFVRRFLLHVLPPDFRKIRHYGLLAPANVNTRLVTARRLLLAAGHRLDTHPAAPDERLGDPPDSGPRCPACGSLRVRREILAPAARGPPGSQ